MAPARAPTSGRNSSPRTSSRRPSTRRPLGLEFRGVVYNPLRDLWTLARDTSVNYMALALRPLTRIRQVGLGPVAPPLDSRRGRESRSTMYPITAEATACKHSDLGLVDEVRRIRESEIADEEAHREADAAQERHPVALRSGRVGGHVRETEAVASSTNAKTPICLPTKRPSAMPSGTGARRTSADRPARATPAFAKPKTGTIRKATQGWIACSRIWSEIRGLGPPGRRTQRNRPGRARPRQGRVNA